MKKKKIHHEEHVDETWLIPYADMLTLLLALFIVMFAMSETNKAKLQRVSDQFSIIFSSGSSVLQKDDRSIISPEQPSNRTIAANTMLEEDKMNELKRNLEEQMKNTGYSDKVKVELNNDGLEISIQDVVLFNSGDSNVLQEAYPFLIQISKMLYNLDNDIRIVGHTDNVPINNSKFRSNWDLSAIRAINVMNFMVSSGGIHPEKLSIQAYGEYKPKYDNSNDVNKAKNRRVEIFIVRKYPKVKNQMNDIGININ